MPKHRRQKPRGRRPKKQRRQVWIYPCKNHPATKCRSHFKINYDIELCAKCRKAIPDERQTRLFDRIEKVLSDCCGAEAVAKHGCDSDGGHGGKPCDCGMVTAHYECTACKKACDQKPEPQPA